jgi:hypothetical protein
MSLKHTLATLSIGLAALGCAGSASAAVAVGCQLEVQYQLPFQSNSYATTGVFTFTDTGQFVKTFQEYKADIAYVVLLTEHIQFNVNILGKTWNTTLWSDPVVFDLTSSTAFTGWNVTRDTVGKRRRKAS